MVKLVDLQNGMNWHIVMLNKPFLVLPDVFGSSNAGYRLVCRNKLLKDNAFTVKNDCQYAVDVSPDLLCIFFMWRRQALPL
jgi:hypothetical protein